MPNGCIKMKDMMPGDILLYKEDTFIPQEGTHWLIRGAEAVIPSQWGAFHGFGIKGLVNKPGGPDSRKWFGGVVHVAIHLVDGRIAEASGTGYLRQTNLTYLDHKYWDVFRWQGKPENLSMFAAHTASQWTISADANKILAEEKMDGKHIMRDGKRGPDEKLFTGAKYSQWKCAFATLHPNLWKKNTRARSMADAWQTPGGMKGTDWLGRGKGEMYCSQFVTACYHAATEGLKKMEVMELEKVYRNKELHKLNAKNVLNLDSLHVSPKAMENALNTSKNWKYMGRLTMPISLNENTKDTFLTDLLQHSRSYKYSITVMDPEASKKDFGSFKVMSKERWMEMSAKSLAKRSDLIKKVDSLLEQYHSTDKPSAKPESVAAKLDELIGAIFNVALKAPDEKRKVELLRLADDVLRKRHLLWKTNTNTVSELLVVDLG